MRLETVHDPGLHRCQTGPPALCEVQLYNWYKMDSKGSLRDLDAQGFLSLCHQALYAGHYQISGSKVTIDGTLVDIVAKKDEHTYAVCVMHVRDLKVSHLTAIVAKYASILSANRRLIIMTSSEVSPALASFLSKLSPDLHIRVLDPRQIRELIETDAARDEFDKNIQNKIRRRRRYVRMQAFNLAVTVVAIIVVLIPTRLYDSSRNDTNLDSELLAVEGALTSIRSLEDALLEVKKDISETAKAKKIIEEEYAEAQVLQEITSRQRAAVADVLHEYQARNRIIDNVAGFLLGILASVAGSFAYRWIRRYFEMR